MLLYICLTILTILSVLILLIKRFLYFKPSTLFIEPYEKFEDIYEGDIHGWYKQGVKDIVILYCHGNDKNISYRQDNIKNILNLGYSILIFDYNGYGKSGGIPNEQLCYSNAYIFMEFLLKKGYKKENIIPYGEDIGSAVAVYTAIRYNLPKIIIVSAIPSIDRLISYKIPPLKLFKFLFSEFNSEYYLKNYKGQTLLLHSIEDEIIPYNYMNNLPCIIIPISGSHYYPVIDWNIIYNFIEK